MKKLLIVPILLMFSLSLSAQQLIVDNSGLNPQDQAEQSTKYLTKVLGLTLDQQSEINKILLKAAGHVEEIQSIKSVKPDIYKAKLKGIEENTDQRIMLALDNDRKKKFEAELENRHALLKQKEAKALRGSN